MKQNNLASFLTAVFFLLIFSACAGQNKKVIFIPDTVNNPPEPARTFDSWEIISSQNGQGSSGIPEWARLFIDNKVKELEALGGFYGKYLFIGENWGNNFNALQQWANSFTAEQDLPMLITRRAERRLIASASLYPDDEYGEFFESLIREISNGGYSGAVKEQTFWLKRKIDVSGAEMDAESNPPDKQERYEFLVLISVDKETLQRQIQEIMTGIKTKTPPTKEQAAAIARIKDNFFEGF
jgi:hypothetical protein